MQVVKTISGIRKLLSSIRAEGRSVGFVPTMGYFHEGHLSLMRKAHKENDFVVVSLFVNPIQFGRNEDLGSYPRDFSRDKALAKKEGVDVLFAPSSEAMYSRGFCTYVEVEGLDRFLCGASRPGHFRGVATVVAKLFNIVMPDKAYFGQKDIQQAIIIKRMARDLDFPVNIRIMPIVREKDGLAMSSRNIYLSDRERRDAPVLYKVLRLGKELLLKGASVGLAKARMRDLISATVGKIDYIEIVDYDNLAPVKGRPKGRAIIAAAVWFGRARLIDNVIVNLKSRSRSR